MLRSSIVKNTVQVKYMWYSTGSLQRYTVDKDFEASKRATHTDRLALYVEVPTLKNGKHNVSIFFDIGEYHSPHGFRSL